MCSAYFARHQFLFAFAVVSYVKVHIISEDNIMFLLCSYHNALIIIFNLNLRRYALYNSIVPFYFIFIYSNHYILQYLINVFKLIRQLFLIIFVSQI